MKKTILSLIVAVGLIGSASASVITITDISNGKSTNYNSQYFPEGTLLTPDFIKQGDSLNLTWKLDLYTTNTVPNYADTNGSIYESGIGYGSGNYTWYFCSYNNYTTINNSTNTLYNATIHSTDGIQPSLDISFNSIASSYPIYWTTDYNFENDIFTHIPGLAYDPLLGMDRITALYTRS